MHVRELVELAALVALHAPKMAQRADRVTLASSEQYWTASKCRIERWMRLLRQLADAANFAIGGPRPPTLSWRRIAPVLDEILASELLTRIWTATAAAYDRVRGAAELEPVARNIFHGHLDARRRLLAILADGRALEISQALRLNYLRRRVERWNDMLLAHVADATEIEEFAFEPARAHDFAEDLDDKAARAQPRITGQLVLTSIRASFDGLGDASPNIDLNRRIGSAILDTFREDCDWASLMDSLWLERISRTASDTQEMIDELLRLDARN